jgi:lysyl-tRNA synthetase, class II
VSENLNPVLYMARVIQTLRTTLWDKNFIEISTPILRANDACARFPRFRLEDGRYLREAAAFALRRNLEYANRLFEIGPCFRRDDLDDTHLQQFTMLDLYQKGATLDDAIDLCKQLVCLFYKGPIKILSVAKEMLDDLEVDLFHDPLSSEKLYKILLYKYNKPEFTFTQLVDKYIADEIEPKSKGCCLIVMDYPIVSEILGKPKEGFACIAGNAEFKIEGIEVVNLYQDDPDTARLMKHGKMYPEHHCIENEIMYNLLDTGLVPSESAGFGIGIERLCRVSLGMSSIQPFLVSPEFTEKTPLNKATSFSNVLENHN